jgi:DnaJ like chaperone protein
MHQFGPSETQQYMVMLRDILKQDIPIADVCHQIRDYMEYPARLQLLHFLFGISSADKQVHANEVEVITNIANLLGIRQPDFVSIRSMFVKDVDNAYKILELSADASDEELKKAYRRMAVKFHPDKVANLGPEVQKAAQEKFQHLNAAYEEIKKQRGMN